MLLLNRLTIEEKHHTQQSWPNPFKRKHSTGFLPPRKSVSRKAVKSAEQMHPMGASEEHPQLHAHAVTERSCSVRVH